MQNQINAIDSEPKSAALTAGKHVLRTTSDQRYFNLKSLGLTAAKMFWALNVGASTVTIDGGGAITVQ